MLPQPIGFRCPRCGTERANPEARNPPGEFRAIVTAIEVRLCRDCATTPAAPAIRAGDAVTILCGEVAVSAWPGEMCSGVADRDYAAGEAIAFGGTTFRVGWERPARMPTPTPARPAIRDAWPAIRDAFVRAVARHVDQSHDAIALASSGLDPDRPPGVEAADDRPAGSCPETIAAVYAVTEHVKPTDTK